VSTNPTFSRKQAVSEWGRTGCFAGRVWGKVKQGGADAKEQHTIYCVVERAAYKANSMAAAFALPSLCDLLL